MNLYIFNFKSKIFRAIYLVLLFIVCFIVFDRAVFLLIRSVSYNFYKSLQSDAFKPKISKQEKTFYNALILGTSRTKQGIHPYYLKEYLGLNTFKKAGAGRYLKYNYLFYKKYKKKYTVPKYLFYGFDYFIFGHESSLLRLNILQGKRKRKTEKIDFLINKSKANFLSYISLLYRKKEKIDTFFIDLIDSISYVHEKKDERFLISGFKGKKITISAEDQIEPINWKKATFPRFPGPEGKYFELLLNELSNDKVTVFIVILPDFINVFKTNYEHKLFEIEVKKICEKYKNVTVLNYNSPDKFELSNPKFFKDGKYGSRNSHLSFYGAEVLNKKLSSDVSKYIK